MRDIVYILHLFTQALASKVSSTCSQRLLYMAYSYMHAITKSHPLSALVSMHAIYEFAMGSAYILTCIVDVKC